MLDKGADMIVYSPLFHVDLVSEAAVEYPQHLAFHFVIFFPISALAFLRTVGPDPAPRAGLSTVEIETTAMAERHFFFYFPPQCPFGKILRKRVDFMLHFFRFF
jgi:hypothetical protein